MVIAGPRFAPMMFDQPGSGHRVMGELYQIDDATLANLDDLESIGKPGNVRSQIVVEPLAGGPSQTVGVYFKTPEIAQPRHSRFLSEYSDRRFVLPT